MPEPIPPLKPSRSYGFLSIAVLAVGAVIALAAAWGALVAVERTSASAVDHALFLAGEDWAEVEVNGLQVILSGDAPSEASRFAALSAAGHEVDGARVIDQMALPAAVAIQPPRFSVEMLRNEAGISLIGLIPAETDREALTSRMRALDPIQPVADFLETAEHPTPGGWERALDFTLAVTGMLPRSKISMDADHVAVEAIAASPAEKRTWEQEIRRARPAGLRLALDIRAPLDVISPYIVRFLYDERGARFDACTAHTPADRNKIVSAGIAAGVKGTVDCTIGLGVPSPDWPDAVARGIRAVRDMGGGSLTFSDADITLIAPAAAPQDTYDRVIGELEADLPEVFSLHGVLTEPEAGQTSPAGPPEFVATLGGDGAVQLRGRVASEQDRTIVETLARARFGTRKVYAPLRLDPALPASWAVRTLAGLEALDQLADGRVVVRPDVVTVAGTTGDKGASAAISRLLSEKLGKAEDFRVNVKYVEALDPIAAMPTPQECVADINAALMQSKITFAPGSAEIERTSAMTVDRIAKILKTCPDVAMEIGGYTDSQGREEMNQALSQRRAEAVVSALLARRVLTTNLKAFGYGENFPMADNDTEEGREANRRIEFSLVGETRPRAEPVNGDAPTIRPPARPDASGTDGEEDGDAEGEEEGASEGENPSGAGAAVEEQAGADDTATDDGAADALSLPEDAAEAATETDAAPAPETPGETDTTAADPTDEVGLADAGDENAEPQVPGPDAEAEAPSDGTGTDPEADAPVTAAEAMPGAMPDAVDDTQAAEADPGAGAEDATATPEEIATEAGADVVGDDDTSPATVAGAPKPDATDAETAAEDVSEAVDPATPDVTTAQAGSSDPTADPEEIVAATQTAPEPDPAVEDAEDGAQDTATGDEDREAAFELPDPAEDATETVPDEAIAATDTGALPPAPQAPDGAANAEATLDGETTGNGDAAGDEDTADPETTGNDETPAAAEASGEADASAEAATEDAETASDETAGDETAGDETAGDETADDDTAGAATDIPAIRPRARPPLVVHPDLAGIRPRPRPANVPDAPTTE